jgi:hypothetical protein
VHEIRMILGNVAALSEPATTGIVPRQRVVPAIARSLTMIREDFSARRGKLSPVLLQAGQHSEVALIQYRAAEPLDVAGASTLLLFGSTVLRYGGTGKEKGQGDDDKDIIIHGNLCAICRAVNGGAAVS